MGPENFFMEWLSSILTSFSNSDFLHLHYTGAVIMAKPLTKNQHAVLLYMYNTIKDKGFVPTYRSIQEQFKLSSTSQVAHYLNQLQQKGWIRSTRNKRQSVEVLVPPIGDGKTQAHVSDALERAAYARGIRDGKKLAYDDMRMTFEEWEFIKPKLLEFRRAVPPPRTLAHRLRSFI